jgi:hypothetical protein
MHRTCLAVLLGLSLLIASSAQAGPITGTIPGWYESSTYTFGDGVHDLTIVWSTRDDSGGDGWFCGMNCGEQNVNAYLYKSFTNPASISDASLFTYLPDNFWAAEGDTIFYKSLAGYYGALVIADIYTNPDYHPYDPLDPTPWPWAPHTILVGTWYFQSDGSGDFTGSTGSVPDAGSSLLLLGIGLAGLRAWKKRLG